MRKLFVLILTIGMISAFSVCAYGMNLAVNWNPDVHAGQQFDVEVTYSDTSLDYVRGSVTYDETALKYIKGGSGEASEGYVGIDAYSGDGATIKYVITFEALKTGPTNIKTSTSESYDGNGGTLNYPWRIDKIEVGEALPETEADKKAKEEQAKAEAEAEAKKKAEAEAQQKEDQKRIEEEEKAAAEAEAEAKAKAEAEAKAKAEAEAKAKAEAEAKAKAEAEAKAKAEAEAAAKAEAERLAQIQKTNNTKIMIIIIGFTVLLIGLIAVFVGSKRKKIKRIEKVNEYNRRR